MKKEYDFSKAERGKFYRPDAELTIPARLKSEVQGSVNKIPEVKKSDTTSAGE